MLSREWLSAFVPIGILRDGNAWMPAGAGVLLHDPPFIWLVTANHVVATKSSGDFAVFVTHRHEQQRVLINLTNGHRSFGIGWLRNARDDVAACLMPADPSWDIKAVGRELCANFDDLVPSMQCYTVGCPYGLAGVDPQRAVPLVLDGIVAGLDRRERLIYISTPTFPGNSGGPIVIVRPPYNADGNLVVGMPTVFLAGIVREQLIVRGDKDDAPLLHLGLGIPIAAGLRLIHSDEAKQQAAQCRAGWSVAIRLVKPAIKSQFDPRQSSARPQQRKCAPGLQTLSHDST